MPPEPDPTFHRPNRTLILGHRGASAHLPENTLASYQAAIEEGAEGIESDIHKSRDDVLLMFHDPSLERTTNGQGKIREKDWHGDIEHVRTKKEPIQPIPRFEELLELIMKPENRHVILNIDVKIFSDPNEIFPLMQKHISAYESYETLLSPRLILGLWHPLFIAPAKKYLPTLVRYHIGRSTHLARKYFWDDVHGFSMAFHMLTNTDGQRFLEDCRREGKGVMTWTVNGPTEMRVARTWGVGWLITDKVALAVDTRQEWETNPEVLHMTTLQRLYWSWTDWRFYSISQSMWLRWQIDMLQKHAFKPGPLDDALEAGSRMVEPALDGRA